MAEEGRREERNGGEKESAVQHGTWRLGFMGETGSTRGSGGGLFCFFLGCVVPRSSVPCQAQHCAGPNTIGLVPAAVGLVPAQRHGPSGGGMARIKCAVLLNL